MHIITNQQAEDYLYRALALQEKNENNLQNSNYCGFFFVPSEKSYLVYNTKWETEKVKTIQECLHWLKFNNYD